MKSRGLTRSEIEPIAEARFWSRVKVGCSNDCWRWHGTYRNKGAYGQMCVNGYYVGAHVVAFALACADVPAGMCVLHKCDNPPCCNPKHLFLGTMKENTQDCKIKGRLADRSGSKNGHSKLSEDQVRQIRKSSFDGEIYEELAERFGVATVTIAKICQRKLWKNI